MLHFTVADMVIANDHIQSKKTTHTLNKHWPCDRCSVQIVSPQSKCRFPTGVVRRGQNGVASHIPSKTTSKYAFLSDLHTLWQMAAKPDRTVARGMCNWFPQSDSMASFPRGDHFRMARMAPQPGLVSAEQLMHGHNVFDTLTGSPYPCEQ